MTKWMVLMWSQVAEQCQRRVKGISISLVFSFKVQVRLDSQPSEAERLKEIHKMPSAWSVTCLPKFSQLWLVWLCQMAFFFSFLCLFASQSESYMSPCFFCPLKISKPLFGSFTFTVLLSLMANIYSDLHFSFFFCQSCVSFLRVSFLSKYLILLNVLRKFRLYLLISFD